MIADKNVCAREQALERFHAEWMIEVERERAFVAVRPQKVRRFGAYEWRSPTAGLIADAGTFYFYDFRAEIAKEHRAIGTGERLGQFENVDSLEKCRHETDYI